MGAFYGSIHVRSESSDPVQKSLEQVAKEANCKFLLGPTLNGWISVFPNNGGQNDRISAQIAKHLSLDVFHLILHDDDVFIYCFYRDGRLIDKYSSCPDYFHEVSAEERQEFQGRPELFEDLLREPATLNRLKTLMAGGKKFAFEQERMTQFAKLLGLSNALSSYEYLQAGERDAIKGWKRFIHVPDLSAERAAQQAAQAKNRAEKKRLQKAGVLLAEIKPPKAIGGGLLGSITWSRDYSNNGLLLAWKSVHFDKPIDDEQTKVELLSVQPPWNLQFQPLAIKTNWTAHIFCMSPSAKWLAAGFASGDWKTRVWNWRRKELFLELAHTRAVSWVGFSQDEQLMYSMGGEEFIVTSLAEKRPILTIDGVEGARKAAVHPSGKFAAVALQNKLGILNFEKGQLTKTLWVNRRVETIDPFAKDTEGTLLRSCLETFLDNPKLRQKLGVDTQLHQAILRDSKAIERLSAGAQQKVNSMLEKVRVSSIRSFETQEHLFDVGFNPNGEQLFLAGNGMRVFDLQQVLSAEDDAPSPEFAVDAPRDDEKDPNSRPLAYSLAYDPKRSLLLSSCLAGVVQYLNVRNGQSGTILQPPGKMSIIRLELTSDMKALCCHCTERPKAGSLNKKFNCVQVWNYPVLCEAAGIG